MRRRKPITQSIQVFVSVRAPKQVIDRLTPEFFRSAILAIVAGDEVPGVRVDSVIWTNNYKEYEYIEDDAVDALRRASDVFGLHRILRSIMEGVKPRD